MGILDNPAATGGWAITGMGGAANILRRLCEEGYEFSPEEKGKIRGFSHSLLVAIGDLVPDTEGLDWEEFRRLSEELVAYRTKWGILE